MQRLITIEDVNLKSMVVEINALTVSGKQMTLSVFRQLPCVPIWNDMLEQIGVPWGRVLYFWGDNKDCNGFQVVYQKDNQLFRSIHWAPNIFSVDNGPVNILEREIYHLQGQSFKFNPDKSLEQAREARVVAATQELERAKQERENKFYRFKKAYSKLEQLPQLFIAM